MWYLFQGYESQSSFTYLLAHKDNNHEQRVNYNRTSGARLSAMEHLVPEQLFSTSENPAHGISAVKAIQLAAAEGQKIWTITQANLNTALANIALDNDIKNDIRNAVYAGKEVTTHEKFVNFYGKTSAGYIILDPTTGAGAYMISSGENGGDIDVPDLVSTVTGYASILLDIGLYAAGEASDIAGQASRFIMTAFSKLFSTVSTVLGIGSSTFSILENCPIEAIALVLPVFLFLTGLAIFLTAFILTGVGAIL
ncbi:MAG TPA: sugar-binding protein, partial [Pseudomonadales bacterium]|nr:sugar-binding protein [Pseudomonadales bacterium]